MRPRRSGSITAFAVLNMVLGGLLLICGIVDMQEVKLESNGRDVTQEKNDFMAHEVPAYAAYRVAGPVTTLALAVGFMVSGVGLLLVQGWGRVLAIAVAGLAILDYVFDTFYQIVLVNPAVAKYSNTTAIKAGGFIASVRTAWIVGFALLVIAYSAVLLVTMLVSRTARVFRGEFDWDADGDGRGRRRRGRYEDEEEDEDDRPRRRSRRAPRDEEEDEEDRPRRRTSRTPRRDEDED